MLDYNTRASQWVKEKLLDFDMDDEEIITDLITKWGMSCEEARSTLDHASLGKEEKC